MLPDIDIRLDTITKALQESVLPALKDGEQAAREQIGLITMHLAIIRAQWKKALPFELGSFDELCKLGRQLQDIVTDSALRTALTNELSAAAALTRTDYAQVNMALRRLGAVIDQVITEHDINSPMSHALKGALVAYALAEATRNRAFFAGTGVDPDAHELPGLETF